VTGDGDGPTGVEGLLARARDAISPRLGPADLDDVWAGGGLVVDIRPADLRARDGALPGALVIDRNVLEWRLEPGGAWRIPELTGPDQAVVLVSDEGYASSLAAATLREVGLIRATDLDGGYQAWLRHAGGDGAVLDVPAPAGRRSPTDAHHGRTSRTGSEPAAPGWPGAVPQAPGRSTRATSLRGARMQ
jgi:rhodanese-related sulfurtransferase